MRSLDFLNSSKNISHNHAVTPRFSYSQSMFIARPLNQLCLISRCSVLLAFLFFIFCPLPGQYFSTHHSPLLKQSSRANLFGSYSVRVVLRKAAHRCCLGATVSPVFESSPFDCYDAESNAPENIDEFQHPHPDAINGLGLTTPLAGSIPNDAVPFK